MWVAALAWLAASAHMSVYGVITKAPHRWPYVEARHFVKQLGMTFDDWEQSAVMIGVAMLEEKLLASLTAWAVACLEARPPRGKRFWPSGPARLGLCSTWPPVTLVRLVGLCL